MLNWFFAALALGAVQPIPVASLRVDSEQSSFLATVEEDLAQGYKIQIECVAKCTRPIIYSESIGDSPMGLLADDYGLLYLKGAGRSAYHVRVWRVTDNGISKVGEFASWHRSPDFITDQRGRPTIRTYEGGFDLALTLRPVLWTYTRGRFVRQKRIGR